MIHCVGWKRLEANRMFQFQGVSKKDFNAVLRRSFVWRIMSRFEDPQAIQGLGVKLHVRNLGLGRSLSALGTVLLCRVLLLEGAYEDMWRDGVFPKDPDLKDFLMSGPAVLAALQIQNAFEMKFSREDCLRMIEDYAYWGGDRGLTEQVMREACGMPPRDVRGNINRIAAVINIDNEEPMEDDDAQWQRISEGLVERLLSERRIDITKPMLQRMKFKDAPNVNKEQLIESMLSNNIVILSMPRGKTSDVFVPGLKAKVKLSSLISHMDRSSCPILKESYALSAFAKYVRGNPMRADNAQILADVHKSLSAAKARAGRPDETTKAKKEEHADKRQKMMTHETLCLGLLDKLSAPELVSSQRTQESPARKRHRVKSPDESGATGSDVKVEVKKEERMINWRQRQEVKQELLRVDVQEWANVRCHYAYPNTTGLRTRKTVDGLGAQKFTRRAQMPLLPHTHDLDIHNSVFTLLSQLLQKLDVSPRLPNNLATALERCVSARDQICLEELKVHRERGKKILTAVLYGGSIPQEFAQNAFLCELSKISLYLRWLAISLLTDEFVKFCSGDAKKQNPDMSILAHLYLATEDYVLTAWCQYLQGLNPTHLSLHFDGVRISEIEGMSADDICQSSEDFIAKSTGFRVRIREKKHMTVLQMIRSLASNQEILMPTGSPLEAAGNCILAAIAWFGDAKRIVQAISEEEARDFRRRSYAEGAKLGHVELVPCMDAEKMASGNYLLHSEGTGTPHCVAVRWDDGSQGNDPCVVCDTDCEYTIDRMSLLQAVASGVDGSTCVFFRVHEEGQGEDLDKLGPAATASLLSLEAAGHKRPATSSVRKKPAAAPAVCPTPVVQTVPVSVSVHGSPSEDVVEVASDDSGCAGTESDASSADTINEVAELKWVEDEGVVVVDTLLLQDLEREVSDALRQVKFKKGSCGFACPCCPWRCFQSPSRVVQHLETYHVKKNQFCCSGTKQVKVILSLHDSDMIAGDRKGMYLKRSAALLREQVQPALSHSMNAVDKQIRLVLDSTGHG